MVNDLEEYAQYSCQVAAATTAGVGPYSDKIFFTTLQDRKLYNIHVRDISSTKYHLF